MAKSEQTISNLKINQGTYAKIQENLSQIGENELVFTTDKNIPIPTASDFGKVLSVSGSGEYDLAPLRMYSIDEDLEFVTEAGTETQHSPLFKFQGWNDHGDSETRIYINDPENEKGMFIWGDGGDMGISFMDGGEEEMVINGFNWHYNGPSIISEIYDVTIGALGSNLRLLGNVCMGHALYLHATDCNNREDGIILYYADGTSETLTGSAMNGTFFNVEYFQFANTGWTSFDLSHYDTDPDIREFHSKDEYSLAIIGHSYNQVEDTRSLTEKFNVGGCFELESALGGRDVIMRCKFKLLYDCHLDYVGFNY